MACGSCQPTDPNMVRAKSAICHLCIYAERDAVSPWVVGAVSCSVDGKPIESHIMAKVPTCLKGKHPDAQGMVKWLGILWYGTPYPMRVLLRRRLTGPLPGCGCMKWAKLLWLRIHNSVRSGNKHPQPLVSVNAGVIP